MRYDDIRAGLLSFFPSAALTPGRLNIMRVGNGRVILDYAHNAAAVEGLMDMVHHMDARRRIGVITSPGDRRDEDIRTLGRLCAGLDHVIVKEDQHRRGREPGAIADLLIEGLLEGGMARGQVEVIHKEHAAMERALQLLGDNDIVVSLIDDVPGVLQQIRAVARPAGH
jgi:cyanophycin synthetase